MSLYKFTNPQVWDSTSEFDGMGNFGQPDVPGLDYVSMQKVMDELPRYIAAKINEIVSELEAKTDGASGADQIGATAVGAGTATTVQGILEELYSGGGSAHISHGTTTPTGGEDGDCYIQHI